MEVLVATASLRSAAAERRRHAPHVLLVDPSRDSLEMYGDWFRLVGIGAATATDPAAALQVARTHRPNIVVSEVRICRGFDGLELLEHLRWTPETSGASRVVLTGLVSAHVRDLAELSGCVFLAKPCLPERLTAAIVRLLRRERQMSDTGYGPPADRMELCATRGQSDLMIRS